MPEGSKLQVRQTILSHGGLNVVPIMSCMVVLLVVLPQDAMLIPVLVGDPTVGFIGHGGDFMNGSAVVTSGRNRGHPESAGETY